MPIYKSVEYTVYCDFCDNLNDFNKYRNKAKAMQYYKSLGWKRVEYNIWKCSECIENNITKLRD